MSAPVEGVTQREFAKLAGCDEKEVRRKIKSGHLSKLASGKMDPRLAKTDWRKGGLPPAAILSAPADSADIEEIAKGRVFAGRVFATEAEAKLHERSYLAHLRQLEFDRESGKVVEIETVAQQVADMLASVRARLLAIPSKVAPRAAVLATPEEVRALLDEEIAQALEELSSDAIAGTSSDTRGQPH